MVVDNVNGVFEVVGGAFVFTNVLRLYRDKKVRGVSPIAVAFFVVWGYWNLFYYPSVGQIWSAIGASSVALVNTAWLCQMIYYGRKEKKYDRAQRATTTFIGGNMPKKRRPPRRRDGKKVRKRGNKRHGRR